MQTAEPLREKQVEFSLVQGGPLFQLLLRLGLVNPSMDLVGRRVLLAVAVAWLPLLVLTLLAGQAFDGVAIPFLLDLGTHSRLLLCVPMLIAAEVIVHKRIPVTVQQFLDRGVIAPEDRQRFQETVRSAMRLRSSVIAELVMLGLSLLGGYLLGQRYIAMDLATWFASPVSGGARLSAAGYWYFFVSLTVFRFLLMRWYFRLLVWWRFLWQVSRRIPLQLNPLHPDRSGGLAFLASGLLAFQPVLTAHMVALAGILGSKIWHEGATLPQFKMDIAFWLVLLMLLVLTPLFFFADHLSAAKRAGLREFGVVGSRYVAEFRRKWIEGHAPAAEPLIGSADIQSLADLANSFAVVKEMRVMPFGRAAVLQLATMTLFPLSPLVLTMIPLEQLIDHALRMFI